MGCYLNTIFIFREFVIYSRSHQIFIKGLLHAKESSKLWGTSLTNKDF